MTNSPLIFEARTNYGVIELQGFTSPEAATRAAMQSLERDERLFSIERKG